MGYSPWGCKESATMEATWHTARADLFQAATLQMGKLRPRERRQLVLSHPPEGRATHQCSLAIWPTWVELRGPEAKTVCSVCWDRNSLLCPGSKPVCWSDPASGTERVWLPRCTLSPLL